jgi:hypothetical protein
MLPPWAPQRPWATLLGCSGAVAQVRRSREGRGSSVGVSTACCLSRGTGSGPPYAAGGRAHERDPLAKTRDDEGRWIGGGVTQWVAELTFAVLAHGAAREAVANR